MPKNTGTIRDTTAASRVLAMGLMTKKLGGCLTANPRETLLTRSVMHKKGKQNDYWERDS